MSERSSVSFTGPKCFRKMSGKQNIESMFYLKQLHRYQEKELINQRRGGVMRDLELRETNMQMYSEPLTFLSLHQPVCDVPPSCFTRSDDLYYLEILKKKTAHL